MSDDEDQTPTDRLEEMADEKQTGLFGELWGMLRHTKKWWLTPIIVVIVILGVLVLLSSTAVAPFIYTLF